ncbi:MAG: DinB family protein [Bacteroidota bacterium]|nr:DinB family protein [Bacteroidota bacterium]
MKFDLDKSYEILERTPVVLKTLLTGLDDAWIRGNEGPETFSPYDVIGHLIHGEKTGWRARTNRILEYGVSKTFDSYDRFAQYQESKGKTLRQLLSTWVIHDLTHMAQITRVMAKQYKGEMGPWVEFFRIMSF